MNLKQRLILLLSEPGVSESEFREVKNWLEKGGIKQCIKDAEKIRLVLHSHQDRRVGSKRPISSSSQDHLVSEVDRLLRTEAGMTARAALEILRLRTGFAGYLRERISFADGVLLISKEVGESNVLSEANQIRNELVHQVDSRAWPFMHDR